MRWCFVNFLQICFRNESQKYKTFDFDVSGLFSENNNNSKMIHSVPSPLLCDSPTSQGRGGYSKLVKRPSVDSGIHINCSQSSESSAQNQRSKNTKLPSGRDKLSRFVLKPTWMSAVHKLLYRFDRSMSLPLNSPQANQEDLDATESTTNLRKMDFALCKYMFYTVVFFR